MSLFNVEVVVSPGPRTIREWVVQVSAGTTVAEVLAKVDGLSACMLAAGLASDFTVCEVGIWGRRVPPDHVVGPNDRIEIYRALTVDPKVARRERFKKQGRRSAGLFVKKTSPMPPASR